MPIENTQFVNCGILILVIMAQSVPTGPTHVEDESVVNKFYMIPGLNHNAYAQLGDINIGILMQIYGSSSDTNFHCDQFQMSLSKFQDIEAVRYAVQMINNDTTFLPNVTFGFVILDECDSENTALAQSLSFLPSNPGYCSHDNCNLSSMSPSHQSGSATQESASGHYDVIGIIGPGRSDRCVPMSLLYSIAQIPIISTRATSDLLSDKTKHRYFLRVVPPDIYQVKAMLSFISEHNWSYVSVLYHAGYYGESAFDNMKRITPGLGICIASSHKVSPASDLGPVAMALLNVKRARAVILFTNIVVVTKLMAEFQRLHVKRHFIFLGSDAWAGSMSRLRSFASEIDGAFSFAPFSAPVPPFQEFFGLQRPDSSPNPWMTLAWERFTACSMANRSCDVEKGLAELVEGFTFAEGNSNMIDAVLTYAHATHNLLSERCPSAVGLKARDCIDQKLFLKYLLNTTFEGFSGPVLFNENGDLKGKYQIRQIIPETDISGQYTEKLLEVPVAFYSISSSSIEYYRDNNISWDIFNKLERLVPLRGGESPEVPESVCSRPCQVYEYTIQKKLKCCWECRTCRDNERIAHDRTSNQCETCPVFTWPDPLTNLTTCQEIPISYQSATDSLSMILICLGVVAILGTILSLVSYVHLRNVRVIKAASRELSFLQLVAILVGYLTVVCIQSKPTHVTCSVLYFLFCLSFTWLYAPLLVKAIRIFRIFHNGAKYNRRPRFISPMSQLIMATVLIAFQVFICIGIAITYRPTSRLTQPVLTEKFVELSCDLTLPGLITFLAYNLVLVSLCSVFAFKTRKLPDNFNESRFMSMCVYSTLVIWLAFIPTYLTAVSEYVRVLLLSAALLLNHTVALVFLFLPKIYAGFYLPDEIGMVSNMPQNSMATRRSGLRAPSNQVSPQTDDLHRQGF